MALLLKLVPLAGHFFGSVEPKNRYILLTYNISIQLPTSKQKIQWWDKPMASCRLELVLIEPLTKTTGQWKIMEDGHWSREIIQKKHPKPNEKGYQICRSKHISTKHCCWRTNHSQQKQHRNKFRSEPNRGRENILRVWWRVCQMTYLP